LIIADSQPGRGTTFKFQFFLSAEEEPCKMQNRPDIICGLGELVLVVDDEPEIRNAMQGMMQHLGYKTEMASNGIEGLEKYCSIKPDAVLMDINMPEMGGVACIEEILKSDPAANISIFSGYNQEAVDYLSPNARAAIKHFVSKPIGLEALSVLLAEMLKK